MIKCFREKPKKLKEVEAIQFNGTYTSYCKVLNFVGSIMSASYHEEDNICNYLKILTFEDKVKEVWNGDFVIKDSLNQFDVILKDVFLKEYEFIT